MPPITSPSTTLEEFSSPFFHFPGPFLDDVVMMGHHLLSQHHSFSDNNAPPPATTSAPADHETDPANVANGADGDGIALKAMIPKKRNRVMIKQDMHEMKVPSKRAGKKDRHSKICTAQGLRDRRIRLSLQVSRNFFDLQDMLGFDKASKTIDWLLINSKAAIQQLTQAAAGNRFVPSEESEEVESEAKEKETSRLIGEESLACREKKKRRESRKVATIINNPLARKSRDKARARARERTKAKLMIRGLDRKSHHLQAANFHSQDITSFPEARLYEEPQASVAVMDELLGITRSSISSSNFSYNSPDLAAAACYAMATKKPSLGIPNAMFKTILNDQEHNKLPRPSGQWSPSSNFSASQQNPCPNSVLMTTTSNYLEGFTATNSNISFHSHFPRNQFL